MSRHCQRTKLLFICNLWVAGDQNRNRHARKRVNTSPSVTCCGKNCSACLAQRAKNKGDRSGSLTELSFSLIEAFPKEETLKVESEKLVEYIFFFCFSIFHSTPVCMRINAQIFFKYTFQSQTIYSL